jgi:hypothetical protein
MKGTELECRGDKPTKMPAKRGYPIWESYCRLEGKGRGHKLDNQKFEHGEDLSKGI